MSTPTRSHPAAKRDQPDDRGLENAGSGAHQRSAFQLHTAVCAAGLVAIFLASLFIDSVGSFSGESSAWFSSWALIGLALATAEAVGDRTDQATPKPRCAWHRLTQPD